MGKYRTAAVRSGPSLSSNDPRISWSRPYRFHASENICSAPVTASRPTLSRAADGSRPGADSIWQCCRPLRSEPLRGEPHRGEPQRGAPHRDGSHPGAPHGGAPQRSGPNANLTGCRIFGISAWDVALSGGTRQQDLVITFKGEPEVTVDNIEIAQFVYLLLHNAKIRDVIDTVGKKSVLLLGRSLRAASPFWTA